MAKRFLLLKERQGEREISFFMRRDIAEVELGWCQVNLPLDLNAEELPRLAQGLRKLAEDGFGSFLWSNEGGEVRIEIVMAKRGETHWSIRLQAPPDFLHELRLVFVGRQEDLTAHAEPLTP